MTAPLFRDIVSTASQGSGSSYAVTLPTYQAGDFVALLVETNDTSLPSPSATGWTLANPANFARSLSAGDCAFVFYRVMDGSEGTSVTVSLGVSVSNTRGHAISYSGADTTSPIDGSIYVFNSTTASSSFTIGSTTTSGADRTYVGFLGFQGNLSSNSATPTAGAGITERLDVSDFAVCHSAIEELSAPTAGPYSITGSFQRSSARVLVGIALQPPAAAAAASLLMEPRRVARNHLLRR